MPLRRRLLALITLVLLLSISGGAVLTYWHAVRKIDLEMSSAIAVGESALGDAAVLLSGTGDPLSKLSRVVSSFDGDRHVRARLVTPAGTTALSSRVREPSDPPPHWLYRLLAGAPHVRSLELPEGFAAHGTLQIETDPLNEVTEVWEDAKLKLAIVTGFCCLVLALIYATLGRALRPLDDLSSALARVGQGDYAAHVAETGPQELASIYKEFNRMAAQLSRAEQHAQSLNEQLTTVQEEERFEIARDLHDEFGPFLFAVDVDAQTIPPLLARDEESEVISRAHAIRQSVGHMQTHLRSILSRLRPAMLLDLGLAHAADQLVAFWQARRPAIVFEVDVAAETFGTRLDDVAFRILQEGTSNAVRHGNPSRIALSAGLSDAGFLVVSVSDDGTGLESTTLRGFGLAGMRERVALVGGALSVTSNTGRKGVILRAELPFQAPARRGPDTPDHDARPS